MLPWYRGVTLCRQTVAGEV